MTGRQRISPNSDPWGVVDWSLMGESGGRRVATIDNE